MTLSPTRSSFIAQDSNDVPKAAAIAWFDAVEAALNAGRDWVARAVANETSVAAAGTMDLSAILTFRVLVTGSATIADLGMAANTEKSIRFAAVNVLEHSAALALPGAIDLEIEPGDTIHVIADSAGNARCVAFMRAAGAFARMIISDTPPLFPTHGQQWLASDTGIIWTWYDDGDSQQWVEFGPQGLDGADGVDPGYPFFFDDSTSVADPGTGNVRFDNATAASVTKIAISDLSAATGNPDVSAAIAQWDDSTNTVKGTLLVKRRDAPEDSVTFNITGANTDHSGWTEIAVAHVMGSLANFVASDLLSIDFTRAGDAGSSSSSSRHGQCVLVKDGSDLRLNPWNGNNLIINGSAESVPDAGVALSPSGLSANTLYYIYAFMNAGSMTLEASATAYAAQAGTGVKIKSGDATRTLVGMARTNGSTAWVDTAAQRFVRSWFNDRGLALAGSSVTGNTTNGSLTEITGGRAEFLSWAGEAVDASLVGIIIETSGGLAVACAVGIDGTSVTSSEVGFNGGGANFRGPVSPRYVGQGLSEGYHYATALARTYGAGTASFSNGATIVGRVGPV
jgi:hypothetical protein